MKWPLLKNTSLSQKEYMIERLIKSGGMKYTEAVELIMSKIAEEMDVYEVFRKYGGMRDWQAVVNAGKMIKIYKKSKIIPKFMMSKMDINF